MAEGSSARQTTLPTGTVTFLFTDIEGSTRLVETLGARYAPILADHCEIIRKAITAGGGTELGTEGDSFFVVFPNASAGVMAAIAAQRALSAHAWPDEADVRIRMGLHTGEAMLGGENYMGLDVHRAARIADAGRGGQVLLSDTTRALVERSLGEGIGLRDLGEHRLRDLTGTERLFQVVAEGLPRDFPALRTLDAVPNNLPTPTSILVGREADLRAIGDHLEAPGVRLLTLTGPGGIGKTRLALQAAAEHSEAFKDGVYFVDLSTARDSVAALQAIVHAVGLTASRADDLGDALAAHLRPRQVLLVLDNFEQVMEAADAVAELLKRCPQLKVLVTSREALRLRGEQQFPVASLALPDLRQARATADGIAPYDAVRLFVERAQEAQPDFRLTDDNAGPVAEICARLDGLPLAIELAAARLRLFSPRDLGDRLGSRLETLRGGARDLPARQRTLRSTIEWSYELLDPDERAVFGLLSVFSSARIEAVEEVASRLDPLAGVDVVERLASLIDKSLVTSAEGPLGRRISMLETIHEFASERLDADPDFATAARRAHAEHFAAVVRNQLAGLHGTGREAAIAELAPELDNLQTTWRYFVAARDVGVLSDLLDGLWMVHESRGWYHGAVALTNDLLEVLSTSAPAPEHAEDEITLRMSIARGVLAIRGYTEEVEELYRQALTLARTGGTVPKRLPILRSLASFHLYRGEIDKAAEVGREVLELADQEHDTSVEIEGHLILGPALAFLGQGKMGMEHLDRAIALFDPHQHGRSRLRVGPSPGVAARAVSALLLWLFGQPDTAALRAQSAVDLAVELKHPYSLAYATFHVALLDLWSRRLEVAHERAGEVLRIAGEHGYEIWGAIGLVLSGVTTAYLGDVEDGVAQLERGVGLYRNLRTPPVFWPQILGLRAAASALAGRSADAFEMMDQAAALAAEGSWDSAALKIQRADLLIDLGDLPAAEALLRHAFDEAEPGGSLMTQLRAATPLARLAPTPGERPAIEMLREVFDRFTEGFDTPDLVDARALLDEAAAS
ncbi:MAG: adenylate/guanylate cyclase domain-containing protein, partial [Chloroflexota bacterium]